MGILIDALRDKASMLSFEEMQAQLDQVCVDALFDDVEVSWWAAKGITFNPDLDSLMVEFWYDSGYKMRTHAYEYHGLSSQELAELTSMLDAFDGCLRRTPQELSKLARAFEECRRLGEKLSRHELLSD